MNASERKKQTHLRCERQRREAINATYIHMEDLRNFKLEDLYDRLLNYDDATFEWSRPLESHCGTAITAFDPIGTTFIPSLDSLERSINGYSELKELLPASASFVGCKTTNAAILFRAADYVKSLNTSIEKSEEELQKLQTQYSALEMILQQYENFSMNNQPYSALQLQMLQNFLDSCFESFVDHVDASNYQSFTRSLHFKRPADELLSPIFKS